MEKTLQELKKKIKEFQERITTLMEIKDDENMIDVSYNALQSLAIPLESELQDYMVNDWKITDENDWLEVVYKNSALRKQTTTKEPDAAIKEVTATDTNIQLTNRFLVLEDQSCNLDEIETQHGANTNTTAEEKTSKILLIGDSIVRNIKLQKNKAKITKIWCAAAYCGQRNR